MVQEKKNLLGRSNSRVVGMCNVKDLNHGSESKYNNMGHFPVTNNQH